MAHTLAIAVLLLATSAIAQNLPARPYPQGDAFPLGAYSLQPPEVFPEVTPFGWNIGHSYQFGTAYLEAARAAGLYSLARLPRVGPETAWADVRATIEDHARHENVAWWDLPEELRYWHDDEQEMLERFPRLTRELDPMRRPNFMYMPTHVTAARIARDAPHLDIIGTGGYPEYHHMPRSWIRYAIDRQLDGIERAGFEVGRDYLAGEKTPIAVLQLFYQSSGMDVLAPIDAKHDFWAAIAAGARGVLVFSYWHKRDGGGLLEGTWAQYCEEAAKITGEEGLGRAILFGQAYGDLAAAVLSGPRMSAPFIPHGYDHEVRYPSLATRAWSFEGDLYVVAVNSAQRRLTAMLTGLPEGATEAAALFETVTTEAEGEPLQRTVPVDGGVLQDSFAGLGVHLYRVPLREPIR